MKASGSSEHRRPGVFPAVTLVAAGLVATGLVATGCAAPSGQDNASPTATPITTVTTQSPDSSPEPTGVGTPSPNGLPTQNSLNAMWIDALPSLDRMADRADVIVRGETLPEAETKKLQGLPVTIAEYRPVEWIKGKAAGVDTLQIRQLGGEDGGIVKMVEGNPLLQPGEESILLLREAGDGTYGVMGGPTGRYLIIDGKVTAMKASANTTKFPDDPAKFIAFVRKLSASK